MSVCHKRGRGAGDKRGQWGVKGEELPVKWAISLAVFPRDLLSADPLLAAECHLGKQGLFRTPHPPMLQL